MSMIAAGRASTWLGDALAARCGPARAGLEWLPGPVEDVLARRRSVRDFDAIPLPAAQLSAIIAAASDAEAAIWPARSHGAATFEILLAAFRVEGLVAGLYRACCRYQLAGQDAAWLDSLRGRYADAPALLLICGNLNQACSSAGSAGYPAMLVRAGTMGYAAWLRTVSAGLAASVYGGPSHEVTAAARLIDENLRHLFTVAVGAPAAPVSPRDDHGAHDPA